MSVHRSHLIKVLRLHIVIGMMMMGNPATAMDMGQAEPENDVGLAAESLHTSDKLEIPVLMLKAVAGKPEIDGHIDESFWNQARSFDLNIELNPERLSPAVVETKALIAATRTHLYIAFEAHDPNPKEIRSALREHDASKEDDYVSIVIDPTGTMARKFEFRVNPDGTLSDVLQDTISDRYIYDWDTQWTGAAQRTEWGYSAELEIPAGAIREPGPGTDESVHGLLILKRSYPRSVDRVLATFFYFERKRGKSGAMDSLSEVATVGQQEQDIPMMPPRLTVTPHYIYHFDETRDVGGDCTDQRPPTPCYLGECPINAQVLRTNYEESITGHALQVRYKHDGPGGLYWVGYGQLSPDYRADLGFVRQVDIRSLNLAYGKKWYFETLKDDRGKSRVRTYAIGKYMQSFEDGDLLERAISFWGEFKGTYQSIIRVGYRFRDRAVNRIDQASLETGDNAPLFDERDVQWFLETSPFAIWKVNLDGR